LNSPGYPDIWRDAPVCKYPVGRLVKELRLDGVCNMGTGNAFLPEFLERFNGKFSVRAAKPDTLHRRLTVSPDRMSDILCHREQRYVGQQLTLAYDRHALAIIKAQQDLKYVPKVKTNNKKIGYQKRERKSEAVEMTA
jgi:hypothetical protein